MYDITSEGVRGAGSVTVTLITQDNTIQVLDFLDVVEDLAEYLPNDVDHKRMAQVVFDEATRQGIVVEHS